MRNINIFWRGVILVAVPLVCQLILALSMLWQLNVVQREYVLQLESRGLVEQCYGLCAQMVKTLLSISTSTQPSGMIDPVEFRQSWSVFDEKYEKLEHELISSRNKKTEVEDLRLAYEETQRYFDKLLRAQARGRRIWFSTNARLDRLAVSCGNRFLDATGAIILSENLRVSSRDAENQLESISYIAWAAIAGGIILGLLLGLAYALAIKTPLDRIVENCRLLIERKPLSEPPSGNDELSALDRLVYEFGSSFTKALEQEKAVLENAQDLICSLSAEGKFLRVNQYCRKLLGYEPEEMPTVSLFNIVSSEQSADVDLFLQSVESANVPSSFEFILKTKPGGEVDTRWSCLWSHKQQEIFCVVQDISEAKNLERLKQDFVDMISHDLRSPLTAMLTGLSLVADGAKGPLPQKAQDEVELALRNVNGLVDFINDLLDFQKFSAGKMTLNLTLCRLDRIIAEAVQMLKASADAKEITIEVSARPTDVTGDEQRLKQVFLNLLANAIRFSPSGEKIRVELRNSPDSVEARVIDNGPGVPPEFRDSIFEAFHQVPDDKGTGGTGLGLAICKLIVEAHGGDIFVGHNAEAELNKTEDASDCYTGSVFSVRIHR